MKRMLRYTFIVMMSLISTVYAYNGFGICNFGKEKVEYIICYGPAVLKETTVSKEVKVAGPFKANKVVMGAITIAGTANLADSKVMGLADITGSLSAHQVDFEQGLVVTAASIMLSHSSVIGPVTISSQTETPYLQMECGTRVTGSIEFQGMAGIVQITDDSIVQGKIKNGKFEFVKRKCN